MQDINDKGNYREWELIAVIAQFFFNPRIALKDHLSCFLEKML